MKTKNRKNVIQNFWIENLEKGAAQNFLEKTNNFARYACVQIKS